MKDVLSNINFFFLRYPTLILLGIISSTAFVYILGLWLNFDACSPKFQLLAIALILAFFGGVTYFLNGIKLNLITIKSLCVHKFLVFLICCFCLFDAHIEYFYLVWSCVFFNYFASAFLNSKSEILFKESIHYDFEVDYYSSYLFAQDCQAIYKSSLNTNKFNCFFYKLLGFCFCSYSYVSCHPKLCFLILWWPSLLTPVLVLKLVLGWFLFGSFLFFLSENLTLRESYNCVFENKIYLKFSRQTNVWLLKLGGILFLSFLLGFGFCLDLAWFSECLANCYGKAALILWFIPVEFFPFSFCLGSVITLIGVSYLMYYSYKYSSKNWVFVFNTCHFFIYLLCILLMDYQGVANFYSLRIEWLLIGTALYPVFWLIGLVFSVRISTGSWYEIRSYFTRENFERAKTQKSFTISWAIKAIHNARLLHSLSSTKLCYNCTYMITIVHLYALAGWFIYHGVTLSWLVNLFCLLFFKELFPLIIVYTGISFLFLLNFHVLSRDPVWYAHFRKANGHYVLAHLGWNMLKAAALKTGKILFPSVVFGSGYLLGEINGYQAGHKDGLNQASDQKSTIFAKMGGRSTVGDWDFSGEYPLQTTEVILPKVPLMSKVAVVTLSKRIPVSLTDLRQAAKNLFVERKAPEAYTHYKKTGEIPVTVMFTIKKEFRCINQKEEKTVAPELEEPKWGRKLRRPWYNPDQPVPLPQAWPRPLLRRQPPVDPNQEAVARNWDPDPSSTIGDDSIYGPGQDNDWWDF